MADVSSDYSLEIIAEIDDLKRIYEFLQNRLQELQVDESKAYDIQLAVSELVTNTLLYGYPQQQGLIEVSVQQVDQRLVVVLCDRAAVYDPTQAAEPDLSLPLERRRLGGYGIYLVCLAVEKLEHQPLPGGGNQVTLVFKL